MKTQNEIKIVLTTNRQLLVLKGVQVKESVTVATCATVAEAHEKVVAMKRLMKVVKQFPKTLGGR